MDLTNLQRQALLKTETWYVPSAWDEWLNDKEGMMAVAEFGGHVGGLVKLSYLGERVLAARFARSSGIPRAGDRLQTARLYS